MENNKEKAKNDEVKAAVPVHSGKFNETYKEHNHSENKVHEHHEHAHQNTDKKEEIKPIKITKPKVKKDVAVVRAPSVHISKRHGMYICSFIKGKSIDNAMKDLEQVILIKKAVPFKGEIPHRKGKGMMSGRYPVAASKIFISILKTLKGNVLFNDMDLEKTKISSAYTNWAPRPQRRGGMKGKRASVFIEAREVNK
nr:50S ribosomal protein L22P [uncultured archaeon]